ncbi:hypothetical protein [Brevibacterium oceani]|uniref:hypothetical protein n=1 Tax=Brevibacterium oceani TaxID=358099 RepID=UPI0015E6EF2C|nr:hypothetical protein [Brevibacterium oceani]
MSRAPIHRKRRIWFIWTPIVVLAMVAYFGSYFITPTLNGLGLLAMLVGFGAMVAITKEGTTL